MTCALPVGELRNARGHLPEVAKIDQNGPPQGRCLIRSVYLQPARGCQPQDGVVRTATLVSTVIRTTVSRHQAQSPPGSPL
jgi:hypothetical protein